MSIHSAVSSKPVNTTERSKLSNQAVSLALIANVMLAVLKTSIGILGHSPALLADGINSTSDVVYNIVVSVFVRAAHKPADDEHPYVWDALWEEPTLENVELLED